MDLSSRMCVIVIVLYDRHNAKFYEDTLINRYLFGDVENESVVSVLNIYDIVKSF